MKGSHSFFEDKYWNPVVSKVAAKRFCMYKLFGNLLKGKQKDNKGTFVL